MKRITILIALVYWGCALLSGETGNPKRPSTPARALTTAEQAAVIEKVRDHALSYTKELPNYICTQRTRQMVQGESFARLLRWGSGLIEEQIRLRGSPGDSQGCEP